jgi:hypothetical protein
MMDGGCDDESDGCIKDDETNKDVSLLVAVVVASSSIFLSCNNKRLVVGREFIRRRVP